MHTLRGRLLWRHRALLVSLLCLVWACGPIAVRASSVVGQSLGTIGLSASSDEWVDSIDVQAFTPFRIYLLADFSYGEIGEPELDPYVGIQAWEAGIQLPGLATDYLITDFDITNSSVRIGTPDNLVVGLDAPIMANRVGIPLASYDVLLVNSDLAEATIASVGPATPSTFSPAAPGFLDSHPLHECFVPESGVRTKCLRSFRYTREFVLRSGGVAERGIELNIERAEVAEDRVAHIAVSAIGFDVRQKLAKDASTFSAFDLDLQWSPETASLERIQPSDPTSGWKMESNLEDGRLRVSMVSSKGVGISKEQDTPLLDLEFRGLLADQSTPLEIASARFFDRAVQPIASRLHSGRLTVVPCYPYDVNHDGEVNSGDALLALHLVTGLATSNATLECSADVDENGEVCVSDVVAILRRAVGLSRDAPPTGKAAVAALHLSDEHSDELLLSWSGGAGYQASLVYDPAALEFLGASTASGALMSAHEVEPGMIRVAAASARPSDAEVALSFRRSSPAGDGRVELTDNRVYGPDSQEIVADISQSVAFVGDAPPARSRFGLLAAVPNPFNPQTELRYRLEMREAATLQIFDAAGRVVRTLRRPLEDPGEHGVVWNGRDDAGRSVSSGVYFVTLKTPTLEGRLRVALLK